MQLPPMDNMPMDNGMDMSMGGNSFDQGMDGGMGMEPPMNAQMPQENYGADFDAGVEANEETDPKKYIQQLTGKLSQSLRKYNGEQPQPDAELSKYVAGMILKQATEGLSQDDVSDIIEKMNSDEEGQESQENAGMMPQQPADGGMADIGQEGAEQPQNGSEMPMNETTGSPLNAAGKDTERGKIRKKGYTSKPYVTKI